MTSSCYCALLRKATRRVSATYDAALAPFGINIAQYALLRTVARKGPLSLTQLGRIADLDRSTIGRNVRVLERLELMRTGRGDDDQREAVITLTDKGRSVLDGARSAWEACQESIEAKLGPAKVDALREILGAV
ncbi:MAG: MarR family transcriptional regulator [Pseudomonadota bacterium]